MNAYIPMMLVFATLLLGYRDVSSSVNIINRKTFLNTNQIIFYTIFIILVSLSGLRYAVGADYFQYIANYNYYVLKPIDLKYNSEIGITLIAKISKFVYDDPQTYIFLSSLITVSLYLVTCKKYSSIIWLSIFLFIFTGTWHGTFNAVRQYLAASFIFYGMRYIISGKLWKWSICVVIAVLFHTSALLIFPMYFYSRIRNRKTLFVYSLLLVIILLFSYNEIFNFADIFFKNEKDSVSEMVYAQNRVKIQRVLVAWAVVIFQYFSTKNKNVDVQNQIFFNISLLNAVILLATMNSAYLARFAIYTSSVHIISIPLVLVKYDKYSRLILAIVIFILFFIYWYYEATGQFLVNYQWVL